MIIKINPSTSIEKEVIPILNSQLRNLGFVLISYDNKLQDELALEKELLSIILLCGKYIASTAGYLVLRGNNESKPLEIHNECIYLPTGVISYFALGCIKPSITGGNTRIFDAKKAASIIESKYPELVKITIKYTSASYPGQEGKYSLVYDDPEFGKVVRFRSKTKQNFIEEIPRGYKEEDIYNIVENVLNKCVLISHNWKKGDILFVNNRITLHDRTSYTGTRIMLRVRFNDPNNIIFRY